jgi:acetyltransferase-like isoleucine patch superfamily enzyme
MKFNFLVNRVAEQKNPSWRDYSQRIIGRKKIGALLKYELLTSVLGGVSGGLGVWLRARFYSSIFREFTSSVFIGSHVVVRNPSKISLKKNTFIDNFAHLDGISDHLEGGLFLGEQNYIYSNCVISSAYHGYVRTGKNCSFNPGVQIFGTGGVDIGDNVMVAGLTTIIAYEHSLGDLSKPMNKQSITAQGIRISDNVWIGAQATVLDGVTISEGAVIGAGSVVTHNVSENTIVVGVPARPIRRRGEI